jgi:hypothetical protein
MRFLDVSQSFNAVANTTKSKGISGAICRWSTIEHCELWKNYLLSKYKFGPEFRSYSRSPVFPDFDLRHSMGELVEIEDL